MRSRLLVTLALAALASGSACGCGERSVSATRGSDSGSQRTGSPDGSGDADSPDAPKTSIQGLPDDIPVPEGLRTTSVTSAEPGSVVALFTGDLEPADVARTFADGLRSHGWTIDDSRSQGSDLGLFARKKERIASVVVTRLSGKLHVELGVWAPKE
jgi:hypothetical protein